MKQFKLISTDMDGTLLTSEKSISEKTKETLLNLQKKGVKIMLCSGRQFPGLVHSSEVLELAKYGGIMASYNGGKIVDAKTQEVLFERSLHNELAVKILKHLEQFDVNPIVDDGKYVYTTNPNSFKLQIEATNNSLLIKEVENLIDSITFNPVKILVAAPEEVFKSIGDKILEPFLEEIDFTFSTPYYLEINSKNVNKGVALKEICKILNISTSEVIAFGDGGNDIEMLKVAGLGVAMANAPEEIKNLADEITLSNNEDGVVHTLNKYFN